MKFVNDPMPLQREKGSALEHALLSAGRAPDGSNDGSMDRRAKTLAALGLAGSATLVAGAVSAASLSTVAKFGWMKLVLGVSLVSAVTAVPVGYYFVKQAANGTRSSHAGLAMVVARPAVAALPAPAADEPVAAPAADAETGARLARPGARTPARGTLTHELAALDAARATLADGDAKSALALLDIYAESFPHGRLELEAEVLRIDALARSGHTDAARLRANAFLRRHPTSVLASRVRAEARPGE